MLRIHCINGFISQIKINKTGILKLASNCTDYTEEIIITGNNITNSLTNIYKSYFDLESEVLKSRDINDNENILQSNDELPFDEDELTELISEANQNKELEKNL